MASHFVNQYYTKPMLKLATVCKPDPKFVEFTKVFVEHYGYKPGYSDVKAWMEAGYKFIPPSADGWDL